VVRNGRLQLSAPQVVVAAALFLAAFANLAFFRNLATAFGATTWGPLHIASLGLALFCALVLLLSALSPRPLLKPVLTLLFGVSAVAAYFMDTYNVIIDREMLVNVMATDSSEASDLLSPRLLLYLVLLGVAPSVLLWRARIRPESARQFLRSRLLLAGGALVLMLSLALISSAFYASFVREHKELRYYANPLTPVYAAYKFGKSARAHDPELVEAIGRDAQIPATDVEYELVIMVVGETARADHFSLNGYVRDTNPQLARRDVISFTDVTACGTSTAISVPCMFDVYDQDEFNLGRSQSTENALDVLNRAGVEILWRDNNSNSKGVADRVDYQNFRSPETNPVCDTECRDVGMLAGLRQYIDSRPEGDILIVLHQMGSHGPAYYKRYPPEFETFRPTCDSNELGGCSDLAISNSYDNTILYTDHFLAETIDLLREYDDRYETVLFYASDHGESLGESGVYLHGLPYWIAPDAQTRVPMIFWFGRNYHDVDPAMMRRLRNASLTHDNLFHTLLGVFEVDSEVYDGRKDLLQRARDLSVASSGPAVGQVNPTP